MTRCDRRSVVLEGDERAGEGAKFLVMPGVDRDFFRGGVVDVVVVVLGEKYD